MGILWVFRVFRIFPQNFRQKLRNLYVFTILTIFLQTISTFNGTLQFMITLIEILQFFQFFSKYIEILANYLTIIYVPRKILILRRFYGGACGASEFI